MIAKSPGSSVLSEAVAGSQVRKVLVAVVQQLWITGTDANVPERCASRRTNKAKRVKHGVGSRGTHGDLRGATATNGERRRGRVSSERQET